MYNYVYMRTFHSLLLVLSYTFLGGRPYFVKAARIT